MTTIDIIKKVASAEVPSKYYAFSNKIGVGFFLHLIAALSKPLLWSSGKVSGRYELYRNLKGLHPLALEFDNENSESYIYFGTDIYVKRTNSEEKYSIETAEGRVTLSEFIDSYSEKTVQPFLFNIHLFK